MIPRIEPTVVRMVNGGWLFTWTPSTGPYTLWLGGLLIATVDDEEFEFNQPLYETSPPELEIVDEAGEAENYLYPPRAFLQWRGISTAVGYVVEQFIGAAWVQVQTITEQARGYYTWRSPALADGLSTQFRVKAVGSSGIAGTPITFTIEVARNPAKPAVSLAVVAGDLVVSAG